MQIVIEVPNVTFERMAKIANEGKEPLGYFERLILNGTPLPKGHGNLIDVNELEPDTEWNDYEDGFISYSHNQIKCANVIIEADAESEE